MPWGRFDDEYPHNRKIRKLSHEAFRLDVSGILWANKYGTDGFIADDDLPLVCTEVRRAERCAEELANRGRWERVHGGWYIHDFLDYNPSAEQVAADREARTNRQQRWRERRRASRNGDVDASTDASHDESDDASRNGAVTPAPRARVPLPLPLEVLRTSDQTRPPVERKGPPTPEPEGFGEFWSAYPKKVGKQAAIKAYAKAVKAGAKPADLLAAAQLYAMDCRTLEDPHFIKHPSGWLNDGRWTDERAQPQTLPPDISTPPPPWCGHCDPETRRFEDVDRPYQCPECHPTARKAPTP